MFDVYFSEDSLVDFFFTPTYVHSFIIKENMVLYTTTENDCIIDELNNNIFANEKFAQLTYVSDTLIKIKYFDSETKNKIQQVYSDEVLPSFLKRKGWGDGMR